MDRTAMGIALANRIAFAPSNESRIMRVAACYVRIGWTQCSMARTKDGRRMANPKSAEAAAWCMAGALNVAAGDDASGENAARMRLQAFLGDSITAWNDRLHRRSGDVIDALEICSSRSP